ncbi:MAG: sugar-transfer associated ATP-grasp domain-containing protein [Patescibacteria group bacterium]|nr:sugar-transfer associated ATP-grasp domain-containing protein [Patescibacteria group bacterium]
MKLSDILGMNARNFLFQSQYNRLHSKRIADSKLLTKRVLKQAKLAIPKLYKQFKSESQVDQFDLTKLPESFVVKPSQGLGGEGILVVGKRLPQAAGEEMSWLTVDGQKLSQNDLRLHILDILAGRYSMLDLPDRAFIEELVRVHPRFEAVSCQGTPDVGVLVFNQVPVMAFLRLPTEESHGKANMFQGAIACGIDVATGVTTAAVRYTDEIKFFPQTRRKLSGIVIPRWDEVLELAVKAAAAAGLGYCRVDIALQPRTTKTGELKSIPMVLEINAQPGLKIQLANKAGLLSRLKRVEGLKVKTLKQGIEIGKQLFAVREEIESIEGGVVSVGIFEDAEVVDINGERQSVKAKLDTGAFRTSIDLDFAKSLGLMDPENILWERHYHSALGREERQVIGLTFYLKGKKIKSAASVTDRSKLKRPMIVGRRDLLGFSIRVKESEAGQEA